MRPVATNKRAFYLMNTTQMGAQLYELIAGSSLERSTWLAHISEVEQFIEHSQILHILFCTLLITSPIPGD